jgi:hypothetical protein
MTLEGWGSLPLPNFIFIAPRVEVCQELIFSFQSKEGGMVVTSVVVRILLNFYEKINFWIMCVLCCSPLLISILIWI